MKYSLTESKIDADGAEITVYGITCGEISADRMSVCKSAVLELIDTCNKLELEPCHLIDVAEDFMHERRF